VLVYYEKKEISSELGEPHPEGIFVAVHKGRGRRKELLRLSLKEEEGVRRRDQEKAAPPFQAFPEKATLRTESEESRKAPPYRGGGYTAEEKIAI